MQLALIIHSPLKEQRASALGAFLQMPGILLKRKNYNPRAELESMKSFKKKLQK
jgi:hypothetical protein